MHHLIFDFDGVLGDTYEARVSVLQEMKGASREDVILSGDEYFTKSDHTRDLNLSDEVVERKKRWAMQFGKLLIQRGFNMFGGFIEAVVQLKNTRLAVVSSGSEIYIRPKLAATGLAFTHVLTFEDHHSKEEKVETICRDWEVTPQEAYFFTDTISDVVELEGLMGKGRMYGCAWGYQGYDKLATVLDSDHILKNFSDISNVLSR